MQEQLFHQGSVLTEEEIPILAEEYDLPLDVISEVISKIRLKGSASVDEYPEAIQDRLIEFLESIKTEPENHQDEVVENAAISLMGAMSNNESFIINQEGICEINPNKPPDLVHSYQVVANVMKLRSLGGVIEGKSAWLLGSIIHVLREFHGESFDPSQIAEMNNKSYNTIYTAEKVYVEFKEKRYNVSFSHHKEAFFQKIPTESKHLLLKKAETFGLGPKQIRDLGVIIKKMDDDYLVRNIRSKNQALDLIAAYKENKVTYLVLNENQWFKIDGNASSIPTGRVVIDLKNMTVRKDNGQPDQIQKVPKSK